MNTVTPHRLAWRTLKLGVFGLLALTGALTLAETRNVVGEGSSEACWLKRETALKIAHTASTNDAHDECRALGPGWRYGKKTFAGYEQCFPCGSSKELRCKVTQSVHTCVNVEAEKESARQKDPQEANAGKTKAADPAAAAMEELAASTKRPPATVKAESSGGFNPLEAFAAEHKRIKEQPVRIAYPTNGQAFVERVIGVRGDTQGQVKNGSVLVHFNGSTQRVQTDAQGQWNVKVALAAGANTVRVCAEDRCAEVGVTVNIEPQPLMATLTWSGNSDIDLHVETPSGKECFYSKRRLPQECLLDIDDQHGFNPENMSIPPNAPKGAYRFKVVNFSGKPGISGTLKLFKNERLIDTRTFTTDASKKSIAVSVVVENL